MIERALEARRLRVDNRRLPAEQTLGRRIVGDSRPMRRLLEATSRVASRDVTVLVRGETGTGKEFVAELLHAQSSRASKPLVRFNCAALPAELADAELFGHVRGAFTGATATRPGFFAQADGGTLILDEVGELPLGDPGQAPARAPGGRDPARRLGPDREGRRPRRRVDQPRPRRRRQDRRVPRGPLLPARGGRARGATAARPHGRHPRARRRVRAPLRRTLRPRQRLARARARRRAGPRPTGPATSASSRTRSPASPRCPAAASSASPTSTPPSRARARSSLVDRVRCRTTPIPCPTHATARRSRSRSRPSSAASSARPRRDRRQPVRGRAPARRLARHADRQDEEVRAFQQSFSLVTARAFQALRVHICYHL